MTKLTETLKEKSTDNYDVYLDATNKNTFVVSKINNHGKLFVDGEYGNIEIAEKKFNEIK